MNKKIKLPNNTKASKCHCAKWILLLFVIIFASFFYICSSSANVNELVRKAENGVVVAQFDLARRYEYGNGVRQNQVRAAAWYRKAAEQGHVEAMYALGWMYDEGRGVPQDYERGFHFFKRAAELGHAGAEAEIGNSYEHGLNVPEDYREALQWYNRAAEKGNRNAYYYLSRLYSRGRGVPKDRDKAAVLLRKHFDLTLQEAARGYRIAQFDLGKTYERGVERYEIMKDKTKMIEWIRKSAEQGYVRAQFELALCYERGIGVQKDVKKSIEWYLKAAEQGDMVFGDVTNSPRKSLYKLLKDDGIAWDLLLQMAEEGNEGAQFEVGLLFRRRGRDLPTDSMTAMEKSAEWISRAAAQGYVYAQYELAKMYESGRGVDTSREIAVDWYRKAAEQGHEEALLRLD